MKCFKCTKDFDNIDLFFSHIQETHKIKGTVRCICTLNTCFKLFGDFSTYKRHVQSCCRKGMDTDLDMYNSIIGYQFTEELDNFIDTLQKSIVLLTLKMCSKPNFPRSVAFEIICELKLVLKEIMDGLKTVIMPEVENCALLQNFILSVETSFDRIDSEWKLKQLLHQMNLMENLIKIDVALNKRIDSTEDTDEDTDEDIGEDPDRDTADNESDRDDRDENGTAATAAVSVKPKCTLVIMPIAHQIKQFLELPNVFAKIQSYTAAILAQPTLNHFIKGSVWQDKIRNYADGQLVIPLNFYGDGVQLNNPIGPQVASGLQNFNYFTFPTIPSEYRSRLNNIMVASLFQEKTIKDNGTKAIFSHICRELASLAQNGIVLNINNQAKKVIFLLGIYEGDNKDCNRTLDYPDGHSANHPCRFCRIDKETLKTETKERPELLRTEENYSEDAMENNMTLTGVKKWSVFNGVPHFHVVNGTANDGTHDLLLGVYPYSYKGILKRLIFDEGREYFTVDDLNKRIKAFNYGPDQCADRPPPINEKTLKKISRKKVKMNAAQMFNFTQNITFLIGDLIEEDEEVDQVWVFVKNLVKLHDLCYLPWYEPEDLVNLENTVELVLENYKELCECLKPVFHYLTHYKTNIKKYGPQRYLENIRKEAKHREIKMYTKNSSSRINLPVSVAKKVQYSYALRAYSSEGLKDILTTSKLYQHCLKNKPYFRNIKPSNHKDTICARDCNLTNKVVVNGITFTKDSWLPNFTDKDKPSVYRVGDIVVMNQNDISSIYLICKVYEKIAYEDHFVAYSVELGSVQSHLQVISVTEYLMQHQHPVVTHCINGREMFRCKRF